MEVATRRNAKSAMAFFGHETTILTMGLERLQLVGLTFPVLEQGTAQYRVWG